MALINKGQVLDLDHAIKMGAPHYPRIQPPYLMSLWTSAQRVVAKLRQQGIKNDPGVNLEHVHMTFHVGTHIDALGHFTIGQTMYGGRNADEVIGDQGLRELGVEHVPSLITRGVLLDLAHLDGGDFLAAGRAIGPEDLQNCLNKSAIELKPGDVVLLRTGWGRFFSQDKARYVAGEPGINLAAAQWLSARGVCAIGADNMAVEVMPGVEGDISMPVHQHCLVEKGIYLIENLRLDDLVAASAVEFCFILLAARFQGATGCPVRPVALV